MRSTSKGQYMTAEHIWFENIADISKLNSKADIVYINGNKTEARGTFIECAKQQSQILNLNVPEEELLKGFSSTTKNEIRRADREKTEAHYFDSMYLMRDHSVLNDMAQVYTCMYKEKSMDSHSLPIQEMRGYINAGALLISVAEFNGSVLVYHSYVMDKNNCRLLHSCSVFRSIDPDLRRTVGRANKFLHYRDMQYFKSHDVTNYDWGGIMSYENPNGIDTFKLSFGGRYIEYNNITKICSIKGKVLLSLKKLLKRSKSSSY